MQIKVNGKEQLLNSDTISVKEVLETNKIERPEAVSVQLNGAFVKKEDYGTTMLNESDEIDFLYFMGGGAK